MPLNAFHLDVETDSACTVTSLQSTPATGSLSSTGDTNVSPIPEMVQSHASERAAARGPKASPENPGGARTDRPASRSRPRRVGRSEHGSRSRR